MGIATFYTFPQPLAKRSQDTMPYNVTNAENKTKEKV